VSGAVNVRYLTGYTGSNGLALIAAADGGREGSPGHCFITDFRYATQAAEEVPDSFERVIAEDKLLDALAARLSGGDGRLGFESAHLTVAEHARLRELVGGEWELVPSEGIVEGLRMVKDARELEYIRAAAALAEEAMGGLLAEGIVGRAEREVAGELELRMRRLGAEGSSFPPIVA